MQFKKYLKPTNIIIALLVIVVIYLVHQQLENEQRSEHKQLKQQPIIIKQRQESMNSDEPTTHIKLTIDKQPSVQKLESPFPPTYTDDIRDANVQGGSYWNYTNRKAMERVVNPLLPPERSYEQTYGVPINVPTRGLVGGYQQVGMLYKDEIADPEKKPGNNTDSTVVALYGRPVDTSRNKWTYYATGDGFQAVKIPVTYKGRKCDSEFGCEEITSSDEVAIPPYNGKFKAEIYDYDKPRYIPSVW